VTLLDGMDAQVAELDLSQAEVAEGDQRAGPLNIRVTDRATAALDVASQAMAFLSVMQSPGGMTREQLYQQIRSELLIARNTHLLQAAQNVSQVECREVGRGEYEAALGALNESPQTDGLTENPTYFVCFDRDTGDPVGAWIGRVTLPTETPERTPRASATRTPTDERWTLQQADAAQYMSFTAELIEDFTEEFRSSCHYDIHVTNTHPTNNLQMECETFYSTTTTGYSNTTFPRFGLSAGQTVNFGHSVRQTFRDDVTQDYVVRCVGYLGNASTGEMNWGTEWLHDEFEPEASLLESGLTVVVPPNPCAR